MHYIVRSCEHDGLVVGLLAENADGVQVTGIINRVPIALGTRHGVKSAIDVLAARLKRDGLDIEQFTLQEVDAILTAVPVPAAAARRRIPVSRAW